MDESSVDRWSPLHLVILPGCVYLALHFSLLFFIRSFQPVVYVSLLLFLALSLLVSYSDFLASLPSSSSFTASCLCLSILIKSLMFFFLPPVLLHRLPPPPPTIYALPFLPHPSRSLTLSPSVFSSFYSISLFFPIPISLPPSPTPPLLYVISSTWA